MGPILGGPGIKIDANFGVGNIMTLVLYHGNKSPLITMCWEYALERFVQHQGG